VDEHGAACGGSSRGGDDVEDAPPPQLPPAEAAAAAAAAVDMLTREPLAFRPQERKRPSLPEESLSSAMPDSRSRSSSLKSRRLGKTPLARRMRREKDPARGDGDSDGVKERKELGFAREMEGTDDDASSFRRWYSSNASSDSMDRKSVERCGVKSDEDESSDRGEASSRRGEASGSSSSDGICSAIHLPSS